MKSKRKGGKSRPVTPPTLFQQLAKHPDKLFTGAFRKQYGALCFRYRKSDEEIDILVITSRDTGRWVIPKGWPMKKKKPHQAAATEAWEEAGVRGKANKTPVGSYVYLKELDDGDVAPVIVEMYQVEVTETQADFKEKGQRVIAWVSPDEAARRVREIELKSLLVNFKPLPR
ncbi:MAG: DNA mismatch repair protein MutT [Rhizobiales bacterium 63-7]|nr:NUDIX hydrolase [Hyphomicrobiales bacterium]OJU71463.1 MAG: DNA mismatch repair protein MutT [Rhizobiales bacterium 63-7]